MCSDSHLNPTSTHVSCIQSALLPPALFSLLFLHVELNDSGQVNSIYEASEYRHPGVFHEDQTEQR